MSGINGGGGLNEVDTVVDMDFHVTEEPDEFVPYIESPYSEVFERDYGDEYRMTYPSAGLFTPSAMGKYAPTKVKTRDDIVAAKEEHGLDKVLVQPTLNLFLGLVNHDEVATALASAYNEWVADELLDPSEGIYGSVLVAPQRPRNAAVEIANRKDERGFVSAHIPSGGRHPPLGNEQYDPIYEVCESAAMPVTLHNASQTMMVGFPFQYVGFNRSLSLHATLHPIQHMIHLTDMIVRGLPVRFPGLNVVMQEAGLGWASFMMRRLDNEYLNFREDAPMLEKMPSEYIRDQFYFTTQPLEGYREPSYVARTIEMIGTENVLFSSDYPHFDFDNVEEFVSRLRSLDDESIDQVCGASAEALLGI